MGKEDKLLDKVGRNHGMKVPEGYFDDFTRSVMESLPAYPEKPKAVKLTMWQRVKPYVYMAAMFAGIWCMMKVFHTATQNAGSLEAMPGNVVAAIQTPDVYEYYTDMEDDAMSEFELVEEVSESYDNMADFENDFGYELRPEYAG